MYLRLSQAPKIMKNAFVGILLMRGGAVRMISKDVLAGLKQFLCRRSGYGGGIDDHKKVSSYIFWKNFSSQYYGADLYFFNSTVDILHNNFDQTMPSGLVLAGNNKFQ